MSQFTFSPGLPQQCAISFDDAALSSRFLIHRVNLSDRTDCAADLGLAQRVGSKSGIAVLDSSTREILLPPSSGAEVDFWVFGDQVVLTHGEPNTADLSRYPSLDSFVSAWQQKREAEKFLGVGHGLILANLKTHGGEERFLDRLRELGIPRAEVMLLDQEMPATDRLLSKTPNKSPETCLALRVSRTEALESVLMILRQGEFLAQPRAIFLDPNGTDRSPASWPFTKSGVAELYELAPAIETVVCCPSRWVSPTEPPAVRAKPIPALAERLLASGVKISFVMTDINLIPFWLPYLNS